MFIFVLFGILCTSCLEKNIPESEKPLQPVPEEESPVVVVPKSQLPKLRVQGRHLKNELDENITLHGFAQTYSPFSIRTPE